MKIVKLETSGKKNKRFSVILDNGEKYDFGLVDGMTYIDHFDKDLRYRYWKRHYGNKREKELIDNLIPSPALFSAMILWGQYPTIDENIKHLNDLFEYKYGLRMS